MNIYKVSRTDEWSYDDYDSFVVIAEDEKTALYTHPSGGVLTFIDENGYTGDWVNSPMFLKVELIGIASNDMKPGIIINSFNAG